MSWRVELRADREISTQDVDEIAAPRAELAKQTWGWPCDFDVSNPKGRLLVISGSGGGRQAALFVRWFASELKARGYHIDIKR